MMTTDPATLPDDPINIDLTSRQPRWGLSKREHFAAHALQGILAHRGGTKGLELDYARGAVRAADALIYALNERSPA